jgi:quinol---cytochrome c reductase iron-sulfur subunit, bacillus type
MHLGAVNERLDAGQEIDMDEKLPPPGPQEQEERLRNERASRRTFLMNVGISLNALVALVIATPLAGYVLGPVLRRKEYLTWVPVGKVAEFPVGETKLISFQNPFSDAWDGATAKIPAYVRHSAADEFTVFAINCAHLNCPVRWFSESQLFMCPCHGGVYYADGSRASGPPERGLFTYPMKIENGTLMIEAGQMPTLRNKARLNCPEARSSESAKIVARIEKCPTQMGQSGPGTSDSTIG